MSDVLTLISEPAPHLLDFPEKDYCSNLFKRMELREKPVNMQDPTGLFNEAILRKEKYYSRLSANYFPKNASNNEIRNIASFIQYDKSNKPYTGQNGEALFNEAGIKHLTNNGWSIEPMDTFHEEDGPVVKITHNKGGEQVYKMMGGDLVNNQEYGGTTNKNSPPYSSVSDMVSNGIPHYFNDIDNWVVSGGGPNDSSTREERTQRLNDGKQNPYGSDYRNIKSEVKENGQGDVAGL